MSGHVLLPLFKGEAQSPCQAVHAMLAGAPDGPAKRHFSASMARKRASRGRPEPLFVHPSASQAGTPNEVTVQQPDMQVQVRQPWIGRQAPWLDVAIRLTKAPTSPSGVLGGTFPQLSRLAKTSG